MIDYQKPYNSAYLDIFEQNRVIGGRISASQGRFSPFDLK